MFASCWTVVHLTGHLKVLPRQLAAMAIRKFSITGQSIAKPFVGQQLRE